MINIFDLQKFYSSTIDVAMCQIYNTASLIIASEDIDEKIRLGLCLKGLWLVSEHLENRLRTIAPPPIIDSLGIDNAFEVQGIESVLLLCEKILTHKWDVLLAHELETVELIKDYLTGLSEISCEGEVLLPPTRAENMTFSDKKTFNVKSNQELVSNNECYLSFLYYVLVDVEISAMEICSHQILNNKGMPREFTLDLTKQIWDEARHAQYIYDLFLERGGDIEQQSYTNIVIERYMKSESLLESLIIQQILQEGNAVEINLYLIDELLKLGRLPEANAFYNINNDEAYHVTIGNKWIGYLVDEGGINEEALLQMMLGAAEKIDIPLFGKGGWNSEIRQKVGFPSWFIDVREELFAV